MWYPNWVLLTCGLGRSSRHCVSLVAAQPQMQLTWCHRTSTLRYPLLVAVDGVAVLPSVTA